MFFPEPMTFDDKFEMKLDLIESKYNTLEYKNDDNLEDVEENIDVEEKIIFNNDNEDIAFEEDNAFLEIEKKLDEKLSIIIE